MASIELKGECSDKNEKPIESDEEEWIESSEEEEEDEYDGIEISAWDTKFSSLEEGKKYEIVYSGTNKDYSRNVHIVVRDDDKYLGLYLPKRFNALPNIKIKNLKNFYISHAVPDGKVEWIDITDNNITFYF